MKQLPNGDLIYSKRESLPNIAEMESKGYIQHENDPLHFQLTYLDCTYRQLQQYGYFSCGIKKGLRDFCKLKQIIINPLICRNCTERVS